MPAQFDPDAFTPQRRAVYIATARYFFGSMWAVYHRLEVTGRENIPDTPFVAVANHLSNADPPILATATERPLAFLAKKELYDVPGVRQFCLFMGAISVDRDKPEPSTFKAVKKAFAGGWNLGMFVEGTRNKTPGILSQPHEGPAYFARLNKVPLLPIGIVGTEKAWGKAYAHIGKPIAPSQDLAKTTWEIMEALSELTGFALPAQRELEAGL
jgi:1-acyl-sn-glycerol-3-phosphate acyltransferase